MTLWVVATLGKKDKILDKLERNPRNIDEKTFRQALNIYGFKLDEKRGKGSHTRYFHPNHPEIDIRTVNFTNPIKPHHVKTLIEDIKEVYQ